MAQTSLRGKKSTK